MVEFLLPMHNINAGMFELHFCPRSGLYFMLWGYVIGSTFVAVVMT
jgi:hypothetical protein